jgi:hypothetical protein
MRANTAALTAAEHRLAQGIEQMVSHLKHLNSRIDGLFIERN